MPKPQRTGSLEPGQIKETVTQERIIAGEDSTSDGKSPTDNLPQDIFEYMDAVPETERDQYSVYVRRLLPENMKGYIGKFPIPFDEEFIKNYAGGGTYRLMCKRGSEVRRGYTLPIAGTPREVGATPMAIPANGSKSEIAQIVELLHKNTPAEVLIEAQKKAYENALDIQKQAASNSQMKPNEMLAMFQTMQQMTGAGSAKNETIQLIEFLQKTKPNMNAADIAQIVREARTPEAQGFLSSDTWKGILAGLIPLGLKLLEGILTPKDPLSTITQVTSTMQALKGIAGGNGSAKPDYGVEIIHNLPGILDGVTKALAEMRAASMLKVQHDMITRPANARPAAIPVVTSAPVQPAPAAQPAAPIQPPQGSPGGPTVDVQPVAVATGSEIQSGRPSPEWVFDRVATMIESGDEAKFVVDFLDTMDDQFVLLLKQMPIDQIREFVFTNPILARLKDYPRLEEFLKEFEIALHEEETKQPLPN